MSKPSQQDETFTTVSLLLQLKCTDEEVKRLKYIVGYNGPWKVALLEIMLIAVTKDGKLSLVTEQEK